MKCSEYELLISLNLSGEISFDEEEKLKEHLKKCCSCQRFLEEEKLLLLEVSKLQFEPTQELDRQIIVQIERENRQNKKNRTHFYQKRKYYYLAFVAVAVFVLLINLNIFNDEVMKVPNFEKLIAESESVFYTDFSKIDESIQILDNNMNFLALSDFMLEESSIDSILMIDVASEKNESFSSLFSEKIEDSFFLELLK